jgi:hypothetical protein
MKNTKQSFIENYKKSENQLIEDEITLHQTNSTSEEILDEMENIDMVEITTKPLSKIWFSLSEKIKYTKPKKTKSVFDEIFFELKEVYGLDRGVMMGNILLDIIEGEYFKVNNGVFEKIGRIIRLSNKKKWEKTIDRVNKKMVGESTLMVGV